jgi:hypothetical protein
MTPPVAVATPKDPPRVHCPYCHEDAELVDKREVYWQGVGALVWLCRPCRAWVPARKEFPFRPIGTLADPALRAQRQKAFYLFESLWRSVKQTKGWSNERARNAGYSWLASEMGILPAKCRIEYFGRVQTQIVIDICSAVGGKKDVAA